MRRPNYPAIAGYGRGMISRRTVLRMQAYYYIGAGALPLLSRRAFEAITGPKRDWWLVQMVALLAIVNGSTIAIGTRSKSKLSAQTRTLARSSALAFALIDTVYALDGTISKMYLVDALLEAAFILGVECGTHDDDARQWNATK